MITKDPVVEVVNVRDVEDMVTKLLAKCPLPYANVCFIIEDFGARKLSGAIAPRVQVQQLLSEAADKTQDDEFRTVLRDWTAVFGDLTYVPLILVRADGTRELFQVQPQKPDSG